MSGLGLGGGYLCFHWDIHHCYRQLCIVTFSHSKGFNQRKHIMQKIIFDLPLFRSTDPETSRQVSPMKVGSHRAILLAIYADATLGLTDEEAASRATAQGHEIKGYWKRCSDLRTAGLIHDLGIRRTLSTGSQGIVCAITQSGLDMVRGWA